ncbi:class I adenylate-forming enzyme family protein [Yoonia litorea]|uniref:Acyl-CoA synthetase (AMP-forming)/AMP-acid ligase II n=1 Tax=Yoonia litorea TaxID=1123755 RepID=A0A1I6M4L9_9RHOB|nr:class I adenylate-forming enzyme family protein [Yoonia litorea]SFS10636.1 Acyl-CoA synthetase (AMP-forming)/AMP-acid ligase II [Yoonia litorea]
MPAALPDIDHKSFNLAEYVLQQAAHSPDKTALAVLGNEQTTLTYAALDAAVRGTATGLQLMGLHPGARVLLQLGNSVDFPIAYLGAIAAGLVPVPLSSQLTAPEVAEIQTRIAPALTIIAPGMAECTAPQLPLTELRTFRDFAPADYHRGDAERPAYILFTSGTSGRPQAVVHAHRAILARRMMWRDWYDLQQDDRMLHAGAFNWSFTLGTGLLDPWTIGATALVPAEGTEITDLGGLIKKHEATVFAAAPGVYRRLLRSDIPRLPSLRHGLCAGESLPPDLRLKWRQATGTDVHEAFGMSECSTFLSGSPHRPAPSSSLGYAQKGRRVTIWGADGPLADGECGTIAVHRSDPGLMLGYLDDPAATASRFQGDWFLTGDLAVRQHDGAFLYQGRADDMMNAGGYRVSPIEVEVALSQHPLIRDAAVCAVQPRKDVFVIAAFYVASDVIDDEELHRFCAARLAGYKRPRLFVARDTLPRGANNKLLRRALRDSWEAEHGQA